MNNIVNKMNRRQFIQSAALIIWGIFSFVLSGFPPEAKAQPGKDLNDMSKYICEICGYIYDPEKGDPSQGVPAGIPFKKLSDTWRCPFCGVDKTMFKKDT